MKLKSRVIKINTKILLVFSISIFIFFTLIGLQTQSNDKIEKQLIKTQLVTSNIEEKNSINSTKDISVKEEQLQSPQTKQKEEYINMPKETKGYPIIGKLEIPKINLSTYILSQTSKDTLNISVTKLYGPEINTEGNICITGHNYQNNRMFGKLHKLQEGDEILITDTYGEIVKYKVYQIQKIDPKDISVLSQETKGEKEVTLLTCTIGALKRIAVKAVEDYD